MRSCGSMLAVCLCFAVIMGCAIRTSPLPELGSGMVRRSAADPRLVDPNKKTLEGLAVARDGGEFVLTWSVPMTNNVSPMQAMAEGEVIVSCLYPADGCPNVYKATGQVEIEPGQTRLISGVIRVPAKNVVESMRNIEDREVIFGEVNFRTQMQGIVFQGAGLTFDYIGKDKDGYASARWSANADRITHHIEAICTDSRGRKLMPVVLDTSAFQGKAVCTVYDKDGKEIAKDEGRVTRENGRDSAVGFIRLPSELWKTVDWRKTKCSWFFSPKEDAK